MGVNESKTTPTGTESMADTPLATAPTTPESSQASTTTTEASSEESGAMSSEEGSETEEKESEDESTIAEKGEEESSKEFDLKEWAEDFFEREYQEHQWSAGAHAPPLPDLTINNEATMRPLAPGEELLSESEASSEEEEDDEDTLLHQWHSELDKSPEAVKEATLGQLQLAMDMDKAAWSGSGGPKPRTKSIVERRGIGDLVERGRRRRWAAEMAKAHPGRYAPYPGRPARSPPRRSAADKARLLQRKK